MRWWAVRHCCRAPLLSGPRRVPCLLQLLLAALGVGAVERIGHRLHQLHRVVKVPRAALVLPRSGVVRRRLDPQPRRIGGERPVAAAAAVLAEGLVADGVRSHFLAVLPRVVDLAAAELRPFLFEGVRLAQRGEQLLGGFELVGAPRPPVGHRPLVARRRRLLDGVFEGAELPLLDGAEQRLRRRLLLLQPFLLRLARRPLRVVESRLPLPAAAAASLVARVIELGFGGRVRLLLLRLLRRRRRRAVGAFARLHLALALAPLVKDLLVLQLFLGVELLLLVDVIAQRLLHRFGRAVRVAEQPQQGQLV